jgi:hypothetical protein
MTADGVDVQPDLAGDVGYRERFMCLTDDLQDRLAALPGLPLVAHVVSDLSDAVSTATWIVAPSVRLVLGLWSPFLRRLPLRRG